MENAIPMIEEKSDEVMKKETEEYKMEEDGDMEEEINPMNSITSSKKRKGDHDCHQKRKKECKRY
jgi:hypothetical protein